MQQTHPRPAGIEALERRVFFAAGDLDASFGTNGLALLPVPGATDVEVSDAELLPDGSVVVAGVATRATGALPPAPGLAFGTFLTRLSAGGAADATFGSSPDGILRFDRRGKAVGGLSVALAVQADGKFVLADGGTGPDGTSAAFVLRRFNPDGTPDPTFGTGGVARAAADERPPSPNDPGYVVAGSDVGSLDLAIAADGKLLVGGLTHFAFEPFNNWPVNGQTALTLARVNPDGSPDITFAGDGTTAFGPPAGGLPNWHRFGSVTVAPDGGVVAAATTTSAGNSLAVNPGTLLRLNAAGAADPSFGGGDGFVSDAAHPKRVVVSPAGDVTVLGPSGVTRYASDGSPYPADALPGGQWMGQPGGPKLGDGGDIAFTAGGRVVTAFGSVVSRRFGTGTLDPKFGTAGTGAVGIRTPGSPSWQRVLFTPDRAVLVGHVVEVGVPGVALARLDASEAPDAAPPQLAPVPITFPTALGLRSESLEFDLHFVDDTGIERRSVADGVRVSGRRGYDVAAELRTPPPPDHDSTGWAPPGTLALRYRIVPPGGTVTRSDFGTYYVAVPAGTVRDAAGNASASTLIVLKIGPKGMRSSPPKNVPDPDRPTPPPDLTAEVVRLTTKKARWARGVPAGAVVAGQRGVLTLRVTNRGGTAPPVPLTTRLVLSADDVMDEGELPMVTRYPRVNLNRRGGVLLRLPFEFRPDTPPGVYRLLAWVDGEGRINESDETNNLAAGAPLVTLAPRP